MKKPERFLKFIDNNNKLTVIVDKILFITFILLRGKKYRQLI